MDDSIGLYLYLPQQRYNLSDAFVKQHKIHVGNLTPEQSKAVLEEYRDKLWLIPELVRNPLYLH